MKGIASEVVREEVLLLPPVCVCVCALCAVDSGQCSVYVSMWNALGCKGEVDCCVYVRVCVSQCVCVVCRNVCCVFWVVP